MRVEGLRGKCTKGYLNNCIVLEYNISNYLNRKKNN